MSRFGAALCCAFFLLFCCIRPAHAQRVAVVVELEPGAAGLDAAALRADVARELGVRVLAPDDPGASDAGARIAVDVDRDHGELVVRRTEPGGTLARRVPLPRDRAEAQRAAVFLIGNIARDQASDVIAGLRPPPEPDPAPALAPAPDPALAPAPAHRLWIGLTVEGDALVVPGANDVCLTPNVYRCQLTVPGVGPILPGRSDLLQGGLALGAVRFTVAIDYALTDNLLVGGRVGAAVHDDGLHAEARATYVLGPSPLARAGVAPAFTLGIGVAQYSASVPVTLVWQTPQGVTENTAQAQRMERPVFAAAGAGVRLAPSRSVAVLVYLLRAVVAGGSQEPLFVLAPELSVQVGF